MNSAPEDKLVLINGSIKKCPLKQKNEDVAATISAAFLPVRERLDKLIDIKQREKV